MFENISIDDCQSILNKASDSSLHEENHDMDNFLEAADIIQSLSNKISVVVASKELMIKCTAACIWILKTSCNVEDCIRAFIFYLNLMKSPVFGSLGCRGLGIRKFILMCFSRVITKTLKGKNDSSTTLGMDILENQEEDEEIAIEVVSESQSLRPRRAAAQRQPTTKKSKTISFNKNYLQLFIQVFNDGLSSLLESADEDFVSTVAEFLVLLLQIVHFSDEWKSSSQAITQLFKSFSSFSSETVLAMHQCIIPALSYCFDRSAIYSDSAKLRASVHNSLVEIYVAVVSCLLNTVYQTRFSRKNSSAFNVTFESTSTSTTPAKSRRGTPKSTPGSAKSMRSVNSSRMDADNDEEDNQTDSASKQPAVKEFSTGPECLLSSLQRMTLLCPDRANVRQNIAKSVSIVMMAIVNDTNRVIGNKVMLHYIHFLTRLARSNRAQHRSFALEIICNMIQDEVVWQSGLDSLDLLLVLIARCADQSPVVRLKAMSTLYDFMDNSEDPARLHALYELVTSSSVSLLDTVRLLASEMKPMLRAKALQVLTCILTKNWLKTTEVTELHNNHNTADKENYFQLPLIDDDVQVIANACQDASIAVRKQAVHCLTEILKSHPTSATAMTTWVTVALPLIIDSESSVVQKVVSAFEDVVLSGLTEDTTTAELSLGWKVLYKIGELNMIQILKHIIGYLIRNGNIVFERNANMSFYRLINMCKVHCEAGLASSAETIENDEGNRCYSEASWILLESFASHCSMKVNNAKGQLISVEEQFQKVGSTKFIFESFRLNCLNTQSHATNDDNYVRILKVLDKFLPTFSDDELSFVALEIKTRLMSLSIQAPVAALMISIQFQISKLRAAQSRINGVTSHVNAWVTPLLEKIFQQLKTFAFGQQNPFDRNVSMINTTILSQQGTSSDDLTQQHTSSMINTMRMTQIGLFIVGELSMLGFKLDETPMKMLMKSSTENDSTPLATITEDAMGAIRVRFATRLSELLQLFMAKTLPGSDGQGNLRCPNPIRAVAFITVGKLCMRDHVLARDSLNVFLRELTINDDEDTLNMSQNEVSLSALSEQSFLTQTATKNSVRNNALLVLSDLCVRHTHLVDRHVDTLACCLQDRDPMIRKNALMLISQLLMQDFVKLKGLLLYRFLMLIVDEDEELAMFATEVIERGLCLKYPGILVSHFSEAFIILNKCSEHPIYSAVAFAAGQDNSVTNSASGMVDDHAFTQAFAMDSTLEMDPNTKAFHESADLSRAQRFHIYNFMATNINDETKIQITAKLVNDILASAVDHSQRLLPDRNNVAISHSAMKKYGNNQRDSMGGVGASSARSLVEFTRFEMAIEDVLIFLRSPVLKIGSKKKHGADSHEDGLLEEGTDGATSTAGQIAQAKTKILKALSSQHMVSHVLPVVMSLKHVLEQVKSPLQGALMEYLLSMVKHHASEVDQALQYDPTLKAEIDFDLRQFERQRKEQQQQQQIERGPASAMKRLLSNAPTPQVKRADPSSSVRRTSMSKSLLPSTVQKPVLKSAHKSGGLSAKLGERRTPGSVRFHDSTQSADDEDPMLRLMSQPEDIAADDYISASSNVNVDNISAISNSFSISSSMVEDNDLSHISMVSDADSDARRLSTGNPKRRSWGVVLAQQLHTSSSNSNNDISSIIDSFVSEQPEKKRSRSNSRGNSFGDLLTVERSFSGKMEQPVLMMMKTSSLSRKESSENIDTINHSNIVDNNVNSDKNNLTKRLESIFATADVNEDSSALMSRPAPIVSGKRSAKVASNSLMTGVMR